VGVGIPAASPF